MIGSITLTESGPTPRMAKAKHAEIMERVMTACAANHHEKYVHLHFTMDAFSRYGYTPRKGMNVSGNAFWSTYTGKKQKYKGHVLPLVWSGESRRLATANPPDIRTTKARGQATARLIQRARGLNRRNPNSSIRMNQEIIAVAETERKAAVRLAGIVLRKEYRGISSTKTTRVG